MLAAIVGPMGGGKTCLMTYLLYKDLKERDRIILANYGVRFPHQALDFTTLLDAKNVQLINATVGIDEAWLFFDARASSTKRNRMVSHVLLQSRKRSVDVYVTAQAFKQLDLRFRQNCDYVVLVRMRKDHIFGRIFNRDTGRWTKMLVNAAPIFSLYDTNELVDPMLRALKQEAQPDAEAEWEQGPGA